MWNVLGMKMSQLQILHKRRRRLLIIVIVVPLVFFAYYELNLHNFAWYNQAYRSTSHCHTTSEEIKVFTEMSRELHFILQQLNITHWLAYGSLWGAIRYKGPLPWDNDLDIGVLLEDMNKKPIEFQNKLTSKKLSVEYQYWGGFYRVTRGNTRADLMVFHDNGNGDMERVGIESYLFFINYKKMHTFPSHLLHKPLPTLTFAEVDMPVPRSGIEVQKYHYPYDWWIESKPVGC